MQLNFNLNPYAQNNVVIGDAIYYINPSNFLDREWCIDISHTLSLLEQSYQARTLKLIFSSGNQKSIYISELENFQEILIDNSNITELILKNIIIDNYQGKVLLSNIWVWGIQIKGNCREIFFSDVRIRDNLYIESADIWGELSIENTDFHYDTDGSASFEIYGSKINSFHLNKTKIPPSGLKIINSNLEKVYFSRTNLEKLELIGVTWDGFRNLKQWENENTEMKEFYRQLKHSHDEIWNKTEANKFFAKEMEYYEKSLGWNEWNKKLISILQRVVSDYWNDWFRAFWWYLVVCLIWIIGVYLNHLNCWTFTEELIDNDIFKTSRVYINPLPKTDEVPSFWYMFIMLLKLLVVYQIGVSLRRISQR
jgi:hypothetical protein